MTIQSIDALTAPNYDRIIVASLDNLDFAWDGMHLTAAGNDVVAAGLVDPLLSMWKGAGHDYCDTTDTPLSHPVSSITAI